MKKLLKIITRIAIINFIVLISAVIFLPFKDPQSTQRVNSRDIFAELKSHNIKSDCWIIYRKNIYNITPAFGTHPGGDDIMLKYCGSDATGGFDTKDKSPAIPHSASAINLLRPYLIQ